MSVPRKYWRSSREKARNGIPEDFETILGLCLADLAAGRATIEDCLQRYPAQAAQLAELLPLAEQERVLPPPDLSPAITPSPEQSSSTILTAELNSAAALSPEQSSATTLPVDPGSTAALSHGQSSATTLPADLGSTAALSDSSPDALAGSALD